MKSPQNKKKLISSSAALMSIAIHALIIMAAGTWVAFNYVIKKNNQITVEPQRKLERRKLQMPVKQEPFMEKMSKPKMATSKRLTANRPQMINIPEQGEYTRMAPIPTFKGAYTNFVQIDNTMEFLSKYRQQDFGLSQVEFMGTRGKAEKVVIVIDTSSSMMYDNRGGPESYQMVRDELTEVIGTLRSATLFNLVAFDRDKVAKFNATMIPATPANKASITNWFGSINTNLSLVGIPDEMINYTPDKVYDVPMHTEDRTGWIRGFQAAIELQPEIIFVLSADWGNVTTLEQNISYFMNSEVNKRYQAKKAASFLDEDMEEDMEEYMLEFEEYRSVAIRMLELENEARMAEELAPKIIRDWNEILFENDVELPLPPRSSEEDLISISPAETRYTTAEVFETLFKMVMDNYGHKGFPQLNVVMMVADDYQTNDEVGSALLTSDAKFQALIKACKGRFRYLKGMPKITNYSAQSYDDVLDELQQELEFEN